MLIFIVPGLYLYSFSLCSSKCLCLDVLLLLICLYCTSAWSGFPVYEPAASAKWATFYTLAFVNAVLYLGMLCPDPSFFFIFLPCFPSHFPFSLRDLCKCPLQKALVSCSTPPQCRLDVLMCFPCTLYKNVTLPTILLYCTFTYRGFLSNCDYLCLIN